jgi:hypothetical protein
VEHRALGYACRGGYLAGGRGVETVGGKQFGGRLQDVGFPLFQSLAGLVPGLADVHLLSLTPVLVR